MKTIIIGAGRGRRLDYLTEKQPKPFTEFQGKRILDWILTAHKQPGITDIHFIGGYLINIVKDAYPKLTFHHNNNWENNNILQSLWYAKDELDDGFICSYADILYTPDIVKKLLQNKSDICIAVDTDWLNRYKHRSQHPTNDGETVKARGTNIIRIDRAIPDHEALGEFIGLAKFSTQGAKIFKQYYETLDDDFCFDGNIPLNKAYLIHFLDYLLRQNVPIEFVATHGHYIEVDTLEDYAYAQKHWPPQN